MVLDWEFLANVSPEIQTLLNGVIGSLKLILDEDVDNQEEEQEFLQEAHRLAFSLLNICNDLQNLETTETDESQISTETKEIAAHLIDQLQSGSSAVVRNLTLALNSRADDRTEQLEFLQETYSLSRHLSYVNYDLLTLAKRRGAASTNRLSSSPSNHFSTFRTRITNPQILKLSLEQLGHTVKMDAEVRGYAGQRVRADIVAILEGDYDIGWSRNADGRFDLIAYVWGVAIKHNQTQLMNSINQRYAVNVTLKAERGK